MYCVRITDRLQSMPTRIKGRFSMIQVFLQFPSHLPLYSCKQSKLIHSPVYESYGNQESWKWDSTYCLISQICLSLGLPNLSLGLPNL